MSPEEALDVLKRMRVALATARVDGIRVLEPLNIAIEATEKQVPKKAIKLPEEETFYDGGYHDHKCKVCDIPLNKGMVYCDKCGNIIDWRNEV